MKAAYSLQEKADAAPDRKHCKRCLFYLDGRPMVNQEGGPVFFPYPGMQHRRKSTGSIYEKAGTTIPCVCEAGRLVEHGMKHDADGRKEEWFHNRPWPEFHNELIQQ